jgi:hypothetical protein
MYLKVRKLFVPEHGGHNSLIIGTLNQDELRPVEDYVAGCR